MTKTGDTYTANEMLDNVLVSDTGFLHAAALLYANGRDLTDPQFSPVNGDLHGFPPTILTSGTRDLFLSNTVRVHRKLRAAGVEAVLQVFEGQSHAQYYRDINAPEDDRLQQRGGPLLRPASRTVRARTPRRHELLLRSVRI